MSTQIVKNQYLDTEFIWQPSGIVNGNIYTSFSALYNDFKNTSGPKKIYFDFSLVNTAQAIPAGTYDFTNTSFILLPNFTNAQGIITVDATVTINTFPIYIENLNITVNGLGATIVINQPVNILKLNNSTIRITAIASNDLFDVSSGSEFDIYLENNSVIPLPGISKFFINLTNATSVVNFYLIGKVNIGNNVIKGVASSALNFIYQDGSPAVSTTQSSFSGTRIDTYYESSSLVNNNSNVNGTFVTDAFNNIAKYIDKPQFYFDPIIDSTNTQIALRQIATEGGDLLFSIPFRILSSGNFSSLSLITVTHDYLVDLGVTTVDTTTVTSSATTTGLGGIVDNSNGGAIIAGADYLLWAFYDGTNFKGIGATQRPIATWNGFTGTGMAGSTTTLDAIASVGGIYPNLCFTVGARVIVRQDATAGNTWCQGTITAVGTNSVHAITVAIDNPNVTGMTNPPITGGTPLFPSGTVIQLNKFQPYISAGNGSGGQQVYGSYTFCYLGSLHADLSGASIDQFRFKGDLYSFNGDITILSTTTNVAYTNYVLGQWIPNWAKEAVITAVMDGVVVSNIQVGTGTTGANYMRAAVAVTNIEALVHGNIPLYSANNSLETIVNIAPVSTGTVLLQGYTGETEF